MTDLVSKEKRSEMMSRIKNKDTEPEMIVRKYLHGCGFRYRIHVKDLPGKPDVVLPKFKTVIFIHGCFWHGHEGCKDFVIPKSNTNWWKDKIMKNRQRDYLNCGKLKEAGWNVIEVFECDLKKVNREKTLFDLILRIDSGYKEK